MTDPHVDYRELARAAFGDVNVETTEWRRMLRTILREPQQYSNDHDAISYTLRNPWGRAQVVEKRTVVKEYFGAIYKTVVSHV